MTLVTVRDDGGFLGGCPLQCTDGFLPVGAENLSNYTTVPIYIFCYLNMDLPQSLILDCKFL